MPSPLALTQSGFSHVFVVYSEPIEIVWRKHLSFYLSHHPIRVMNPLIGAISKWEYVLLLKLWWKVNSTNSDPGSFSCT